MSDSEEDEWDRKDKVEAMPEFKLRFTDMQPPLVEKAIRCKYSNSLILISI